MANRIRYVLIFMLLLSVSDGYGQTLVMNEVSQGESGSQEYVEFIVVDSTVVYDCNSSVPPCIDIRGWIIDDNSGYHGPSGIAAGACRFSFDPLWSCVPLGTIIVIYNDAAPNPELPANDVSLTDGNCGIVAPISDPALFESNSTTPGAAACSYPATGWTPGGTWTNIVMANGGDCFRIVDLAGCEVFSVCWDDDNQNNLIYFPGGATSGTSATNTVYYFNDVDPNNQANWTVGCADVPACGVQDQTPGAPNNAANAAYIAQFNNGCTPITPTVVNAVSADGCSCTGTGTASASGSIGGYTYEWYDNTYTSIGQSTANATGLCPGTYHVIGTSSIGCPDTASIIINTVPGPDPGTNGTLTTCSISGTTDLFGQLGGAPDAGGTWSPAMASGTGMFDPTLDAAGVYTYVVGTSPCLDSATVTVTVDTPGDPGTNGSISFCFGDPSADLFAQLGGTPDLGGTWSPVLTSGTGIFDPAVDAAGTYTYSIVNGVCPVQTADIVVTVNNCCTSMDTIDYDSFEYSTVIPDIVPGATYHDTPQNWAVRTGATSVYMNFQNGFQGVAYDRTYNVCIGQTYQLSAWFSNTWGGTPDVDLRIIVYDGTGTIIHQTPSLVAGGPWVQYNSGQFTATTTTIRFEVYNNIPGGVGNNDCSMDDIILERCSMPVNNSNAGTYCSSDPGFNLYNSIFIPLSNAGTWSGPSALAGGYLGTFDPATNSGGTYTYTITGAGACPDSIATIDITVIPGPVLDSIPNVTVCSGYLLPNITGTSLTGNEAYYDGPGGTGTQYLSGQVINTSTTLYAYDVNTGPPVCSSEMQFDVAITSALVDLGNDTTLCQGETVTFDAGPGFDTYLWQDASANQTYSTGTAGVYWCEVGVLGTNQVQNGDFELGDNFFTSGYTNGVGGAWGPLSSAGTYEVSTNPQLEHTNFMPCGDHTTGSGQMMVVNGSNVAGTNVWCQTVTVSPGTDYMFSTWISNAINDPNVAQLQFSIDGAPLGSVFSTSATGCLWQEFSSTWNSGASTSVTICITNQNTSGGGNDFMLDDIFFAPVCLHRDSVEVFIQLPPDPGTDSTINFCPSDPVTDLFGILGGTPETGGVWSPALTSGSGVFDPAIDPDGPYDYTVAGGLCPDSSATITVVINGISDPTITPPPNFCEVDPPYNMTAASAGGTWSGPGVTDALLGTFDPAVALAGSHEVIYTIPGACGGADTVFITVNAPVNAGVDASLSMCITDPAVDMDTLIAPADPGGLWLPGLSSGTGVIDPAVDPAGTYGYIVNGPGACPNDTAEVIVVIANLADATITAAGPFCENDLPVNLVAATGGGTWSGTGITDPVVGTFDPAIAGTGTHTITYDIAGSCGASDTEDIIVNPVTDPTTNPQADICESAGNIFLSAVNPGGTWDGNGIINVNTGEFDPTLLGAGSYTVTYTINGTCPTSDDLTFNVLPDLIPTISVPGSYCIDAAPSLLTADLPGGTWTGPGITNSTTGEFSLAVAGVGTHEVIYTIGGMCGGADTVNITVNDLPNATITLSDSLGCPVLDVTVDYNTTSTLIDCIWNISNGINIGACGPQNLSFSTPGCYDVTLSITDNNGCSQTIVHPNQICVVAPPVAAFSYSPLTATELEPTVDFTNLSSNATNYIWTMDSTQYSTTDVSHAFSGAGSFNTCLVASNDLNCIDTTCQIVTINGTIAIYVPNAFTPNGSGTNDLFGPSVYGFIPEEFEFMIFNRWGELIWNTQIPGEMWDGIVSKASIDLLAQEDVYVWKLVYREPGTPEKKTMIGHVTVLR